MSDETRQERATATAVGIATAIAKEIAMHTPQKPKIDFEVWVLRIAHAILTFPELPHPVELRRVALEIAGAAWTLKPFENITMDDVEANRFADFIEKEIMELFPPEPPPVPKPRTPEEVLRYIDACVSSGWESGVGREDILVLLNDLAKSGGKA